MSSPHSSEQGREEVDASILIVDSTTFFFRHGFFDDDADSDMSTTMVLPPTSSPPLDSSNSIQQQQQQQQQQQEEESECCSVHEIPHNSLSASLSPSRPCVSRQMNPLSEFNVRTFFGRESKDQQWIEMEGRILILLDGNLEYLDLFRKLYDDDDIGIQNSTLLESMAFLCTPRERLLTKYEASYYYENVSTVAAYLSVGRVKRIVKIAVLRTLMSCLSPIEAKWQILDSVLEGTIEFLTKRSIQEWEFMDHTETVLIWELRALSLYFLELKQEWVTLVTRTANTASVVISAGASIIEEGVSRSGSTLSDHIEYAGLQLKGNIQANESPMLADRDAVVALTFVDAVKRVSEGAKHSTEVALDSFKGATSKGMQIITDQIGQGMPEDCISSECRDALRAVGKVGMATLGAAAVVGDALNETSRTLMEKTAVVTADVIQHRYGSSAGKVASDAGETAVNIVRTLGNVAVVAGGATTVARTAAKQNVRSQAASDAQRAKETLRIFEEQAKSFFNATIGTNDGSSPQKQISLSRGSSSTGTSSTGSLSAGSSPARSTVHEMPDNTISQSILANVPPNV